MACDTCGRTSFAKPNESYCSNDCKYIHARVVPRARCNVNIADNTCIVVASLFGDVAEKFLHLSADKLMNKTVQDHIIANAELDDYSANNYFVYLRFSNPDPRTNQPRFDVLYIVDDNNPSIEGSPIPSPYQSEMANTATCVTDLGCTQKMHLMHEEA